MGVLISATAHLDTNNTNSNDNNNNTGTAVSPVQPDPGNAASAPANGPVNVVEPAPATIPNSNDQPGSTPPAAPVTTNQKALNNTPRTEGATTTHRIFNDDIIVQ